ncbi:hypothetical protein F5Y03DRAFT_354084, partial [Xylaria venustula]
MLAVDNSHDAVAKLLLNRGAQVDAADKNGWTASTFALQHGHYTIDWLLGPK